MSHFLALWLLWLTAGDLCSVLWAIAVGCCLELQHVPERDVEVLTLVAVSVTFRGPGVCRCNQVKMRSC